MDARHRPVCVREGHFVRLLIADDQQLFAGSLKVVLDGHGVSETEVVGIAYNGREALDLYGVQIAFKSFNPYDGILGSPWVGFHHVFVNSLSLLALRPD